MRKWMVFAAVMGLMWSAPLPGADAAGQCGDDEVWTVAVLADLNEEFGSTHYSEDVTEAVDWITGDLQPDLVVVAGDMVAGQMEGLNYPAMWSAFHETVSDELSDAGIPMAVTPGNHDASEQPRFWRERIEFVRQWEMRRPRLQFRDQRMYPLYYAFQMGPALFVSLDGTGVGELDDGQIDWIDQTLAEHSDLDVVIMMSHVPQYPVAQGREHEIFDDRRLARLKEQYGVDLMISGHHHAYFPAIRDGTYLLHTQALGAGTRPLVGEDEARPRNAAVVQYDCDGIRSIEAYESPEFDQRVDIEDLPESIEVDDHRLWRMDVE